MILIKNSQTKIKVNETKIKKYAQACLDQIGYPDFDLGIWLTTNATIKKYNNSYRNKNKATDILSFPFHQLNPGQKIKALDSSDKNFGDIIISLEFVQKDAPKRWGQTFEQRMPILIVHGICHLLGYDHENDADYKVMHKQETALLKKIL
jgi:probable rRNA maturation factor